MSNFCFQKYPSSLRTSDTPTHEVVHHIHTGSHPPVLQNPTALIQKNLRLPKRNLKVWNPLALFVIQNSHGPLLCTWFPEKMDHGGLVAIIAV
jgi:hypothetical protein